MRTYAWCKILDLKIKQMQMWWIKDFANRIQKERT